VDELAPEWTEIDMQLSTGPGVISMLSYIIRQPWVKSQVPVSFGA